MGFCKVHCILPVHCFQKDWLQHIDRLCSEPPQPLCRKPEEIIPNACLLCIFRLYLVCTHTTKIRALWSREALLGPAIRVAVGVEEGELLRDGEPGPQLAGFVHYLLAVSPGIKNSRNFLFFKVLKPMICLCWLLIVLRCLTQNYFVVPLPGNK